MKPFDRKKTLRKAFKGAIQIKRSALERGALALEWNGLIKRAPQGDGHPVIVFPGFMTNDAFTAPLRASIAEKGYKVYGWEGGYNLGLNAESIAHLRAHIKKVYEENGRQKVSLVGHSLGGFYARELAREFPDMVRDVVTLGTPFGAMDDKTATPAHLRALYTQINPDTANILQDEANHDRLITPPPVPTTSIYSKSDETVDWYGCLNPATALTENIRVRASHAGIPFNPAAVKAVLDRLGQPEGEWKPFAPKKSPLNLLRYPGRRKKLETPQNPKWDSAKPSQQIFTTAAP
jgi:pimeloyl-ACP methyl ester carboxylesterase